MKELSNKLELMAKEVLASKENEIFKYEYEKQIQNHIRKRITEFRNNLTEEMLSWADKRFDDYHVQRYLDNKDNKDKIKKQLSDMTFDLVFNSFLIK